MIIETLSEATRKELEALSKEAWRVLAYEMSGDLPASVDPALREFLETVEERPLVDPKADPVALVRGGRRD